MKHPMIWIIVFVITISSSLATVDLTWEDLADGAITLSDFGMPEDSAWRPEFIDLIGNGVLIEIDKDATQPPEGDFHKLPDGGWYVEFNLPEFDDTKAIAPDYYEIYLMSFTNTDIETMDPLYMDVYLNDENPVRCTSGGGYYENYRSKTYSSVPLVCSEPSHNALNWGGENIFEIRRLNNDYDATDYLLPSTGIYGIASKLKILNTTTSPQIMEVGETAKIKVEVENYGGVTQRANLVLASAYGSCIRPQSQPLNLEPGETKEIEFRFTALEEGTYPNIAMLTWCDTSECQDEIEAAEVIAVDFAYQKPGSCDGYEVEEKEVSDKVTLRQKEHDIEAYTELAKIAYKKPKSREETLEYIGDSLDYAEIAIGIVENAYLLI